MLALGDGHKLVTGSVEVHLRCADWWAHGHHTDPRYNSVALHVVMWPTGARAVTRSDGETVPTLVLADYITVPTHELLDKLPPLVGNLGTLSEEPCWQRTEHWPVERLLAHIEAAGDARLHARAALMEAGMAVGSPDDVFYQGVMDALGYSANRRPMRDLAALLPVTQLLALPLGPDEQERALLLEAVLLGAAGLLPSQRPLLGPLDWQSAQHAEELERLWSAHLPVLGLWSGGPKIAGWKMDRARPANWPPRRLAAAAHLLARLLWQRGGMLGPFVDAVGGAHSAHTARLAAHWTQLLTVPAQGYWATHADFGHPLSGQGEGEGGAALIGRSRAADMVVNVLLPTMLAYADRTDDDNLRRTAQAVYASYPKLSENRITRAMADEALGPHRKGAITTARQQQGLIHLYRLYCEARRCYECPISGIRGMSSRPLS
jgi:hypothetical protein